MYYRGLKEKVKDKLMRTRANTTTLANLVCVAIEIDNCLYKQAIEKRYTSYIHGYKGYMLQGKPLQRNSNTIEINVL